ncbi:hypothetical protein B7486_09650 [cyanobacterium TDX16]|nr:hypothetical protein B7486_09650 [cyanobacterium TDX16]
MSPSILRDLHANKEAACRHAHGAQRSGLAMDHQLGAETDQHLSGPFRTSIPNADDVSPLRFIPGPANIAADPGC